jgi:hypothetical protein
VSAYQYYEFQAVDRPLSEADQRALREVSTRARISATSFTNSYDWGDFGGDPAEFMRRWFDLHLYYVDWGSRRLMMRFPKRLLPPQTASRFLRSAECGAFEAVGDNLILDIFRDEIETDDYEDDGTGWLAELAPLRADVLGGDLRLLYLLWLMAVESDAVSPDEPEPLPGLGPMTAALEAFVDFFQLDGDLVDVAAERAFTTVDMNSSAARQIVSALPEREKTEWLTRLIGGNPSTAAEFRSLVRTRLEADTAALPARTAGELRAQAKTIRDAGCARRPRKNQQGSNVRRQKWNAPGASGSKRYARKARLSGTRSRPRSSVATRPGMTVPAVCSATSR